MTEPHHDRASIDELRRRIDRLERGHSKRAVRIGGLLAVLALTVGATTLVPDTLAARSFRLVDVAGTERAALVATDGGAVALKVYDAKGAVAAELVLSPTEPLLSVLDALGGRVGASSPPPKAEPAAKSPAAPGSPAGEEDKSFDWLN